MEPNVPRGCGHHFNNLYSQQFFEFFQLKEALHTIKSLQSINREYSQIIITKKTTKIRKNAKNYSNTSILLFEISNSKISWMSHHAFDI